MCFSYVFKIDVPLTLWQTCIRIIIWDLPQIVRSYVSSYFRSRMQKLVFGKFSCKLNLCCTTHAAAASALQQALTNPRVIDRISIHCISTAPTFSRCLFCSSLERKTKPRHVQYFFTLIPTDKYSQKYSNIKTDTLYPICSQSKQIDFSWFQ